MQVFMLKWIVIVERISTDDTKNGQRKNLEEINEDKTKFVSMACVKRLNNDRSECSTVRRHWRI